MTMTQSTTTNFDPLRSALGEEKYAALQERRRKLRICMTCMWFAHDEDAQDVCYPPHGECLLDNNNGE